MSKEHLRGVILSTTVFTCGWVLMGVEMLGLKMLAPYFGGGIYVWGSVIGVFLLSLAVGYYVGGQLSLRFASRSTRVLPIIVGASGLAILALPLLSDAINPRLDDLEARWGSLLSATSLFFLPSFLLGMVSPYAIRLAARDVESVGLSAGSLFAVSTVGGFLGCIVTSFWLVLLAGTRVLLTWMAVGLISMSAVLFLLSGALAVPRSSPERSGAA